MGFLSKILGKLFEAGYEAVDNSLRERSVRKATEEGNWSYAADLCEEGGDLVRAGDICYECRAFSRAVKYYDKAGRSRKLLSAMLAGYRAELQGQRGEDWFSFDTDSIVILEKHRVLKQFVEEAIPLTHGQDLYTLASKVEKVGNERLAADLYLRLAREGDENKPDRWNYLYEKPFDFYLKDGRYSEARDLALEWFKRIHNTLGTFFTEQMAKLWKAGELVTFAEEAVNVRRHYFFDQLGDLIDFGFGTDKDGREHDIRDFEDVIDLFVKHYKQKPAAYNVGYVAEWYEKIGKPEKAEELRRFFSKDRERSSE